MGRIVGDSDTYPLEITITLGEGFGTRLGTITVDAPSISTIAKVFDTKSQALTGWAYKTGLQGCLELAKDQPIGDWDYEHLYQRLKLKGFTPYTKRKKAAQRGNDAHQILEDLAGGEPVAVVTRRAAKIEGEARGYAEGVLNFWLAVREHTDPLMVEEPVAGLYPRPFAGTLDLYAVRGAGLVLSDLKTSKDVYPEHAIQLDGYRAAVAQARPDLPEPESHSVILVREDGTWDEQYVPSVPTTWEAALEGWYATNELKIHWEGR